MIAQLVRLAAFQNPEFYRAQAMRLPTFGKPRIVSCAELHPQHIALPRGCFDEAVGLLSEQGASVDLDDLRENGTALPETVRFCGELRQQQSRCGSVENLRPAMAPPQQKMMHPSSAASSHADRHLL